MKKSILKGILLIFLNLSLFFQNSEGQTKSKKTVQKRTSGKSATTPATNTQVLDASTTPRPADTVRPTPPPPQKDPFAFDSVRLSQRADGAVTDRKLNKDRVPLLYEHIREDDAWYRERVWREIDIREKMNQAFRNRSQDDNGDQRFINILLRSIRKGDVTSFNASLDDRFTTPLTLAEVGELISGRCDSAKVTNWATGGKTKKDTLICKEFNPDDIVKYRIKEEWIFDKESSRMMTRILGIAPMKTEKDENSGNIIEYPLFWVYYPDLRPVLARYEVYNGKNFGARMSWEELFESRYFASTIVKSTIENPYDMFIKQYFKDGIMRLLEGENIKEKIFNFEQDLWSF